MEDEGGSFVDSVLTSEDPVGDLHEDSSDSHAPAAEGDGKPADGSTTPPAAAAGNPEVQALQQQLADLKDDLRVNQQRLDYFQTEAGRNRQPETQQVEQPKPFQFNRDEFSAAMEKDPATAIYDLVNKMQEAGISLARRDIESTVDGKLNQTQNLSRLQTSFKEETETVARDYADFIGLNDDGKVKNPAFDNEAMEYAQSLARRRGARAYPADVCRQMGVPMGTLVLSPGDLTAAADAVYGRWARAGKIQPKNDSSSDRQPLRRVYNNVSSDDLGNGSRRNGGGSGREPKTINDLVGTHFGTQREADAAREWIKPAIANGDITEERYVRSIVRNRRNGNIGAN